MTEAKFLNIIYSYFLKSIVLKRSFLFNLYHRYYQIKNNRIFKKLSKKKRKIILKNKKEHIKKSFLFFALTLFFIIFINLVKI